MRPRASEGSRLMSTVCVAVIFLGAPVRAAMTSMTLARASSKENMGLQPRGESRAARDDRGIALRAGRNHSDFELQLIGDEAQIIASRDRQIAHVANSRCRLLPARKCLVLRFDLCERLHVGRHVRDCLAFVSIAQADFDLT